MKRLLYLTVFAIALGACSNKGNGNAEPSAASEEVAIGVGGDDAYQPSQQFADGDFSYPAAFSHEEVFVDDVPASVEVFAKDDVQLCYWPLLGVWSTLDVFPEEGVWLSPTETVASVTNRDESKGIASGTTQNGNVFYLKQKIVSDAELDHSRVLVLINPPALQDKVSALTNEVANW